MSYNAMRKRFEKVVIVIVIIINLSLNQQSNVNRSISVLTLRAKHGCVSEKKSESTCINHSDTNYRQYPAGCRIWTKTWAMRVDLTIQLTVEVTTQQIGQTVWTSQTCDRYFQVSEICDRYSCNVDSLARCPVKQQVLWHSSLLPLLALAMHRPRQTFNHTQPVQIASAMPASATDVIAMWSVCLSVHLYIFTPVHPAKAAGQTATLLAWGLQICM